MAHNNTASLGKFISNDLVNFEKCRDRFGQFFCSRIDSKHLDFKLKVFKIDDSRDFGFAQNFTIGEADFNQFKQLRNQLVKATEKNGGEENLSLVLIPTKSKYKDEQLKLAQKFVDVMDWANRMFCETQLRYSVDKPDSSHVQVRILARKNENETFQSAYVIYKLQEFIYLLHKMDSVYDMFIANKPICYVAKKVIISFYSWLLFLLESGRIGKFGDKSKFFLRLMSKLGPHHVVLGSVQLRKFLQKNSH